MKQIDSNKADLPKQKVKPFHNDAGGTTPPHKLSGLSRKPLIPKPNLTPLSPCVKNQP